MTRGLRNGDKWQRAAGNFRQRNFKNEQTANFVFSPVSTAKSLCARRNVPVISAFIRVAVACEHVQGLHCIFSHSGTRILKFSWGEHAPPDPLNNAQSRSAQAPSLKNVLCSPWCIRLSQHRRSDVMLKFWRRGNLSEIATYQALKCRPGDLHNPPPYRVLLLSWKVGTTWPLFSYKWLFFFRSSTKLCNLSFQRAKWVLTSLSQSGSGLLLERLSLWLQSGLMYVQ